MIKQPLIDVYSNYFNSALSLVLAKHSVARDVSQEKQNAPGSREGTKKDGKNCFNIILLLLLFFFTAMNSTRVTDIFKLEKFFFLNY